MTVLFHFGAWFLFCLSADTLDAQSFKTLLSFSGTNGVGPVSDLTLSGSTLFGMTSFGAYDNNGTVFSINTDGSGFQNLVLFQADPQAQPGLTKRANY
jgi:uncharacterized repeat protein (TIGR03803 family)